MLKDGVLGWLQLFVRPSFLREFKDDVATEILNEIVQLCEVDCKDDRGEWSMIYMRLRFSAVMI
jgi:hypothetical protein